MLQVRKMGTRGYIVYIHKGKYYGVYNHYDSYPEGLGINLVESLVNFKTNKKNIEELIEELEKLDGPVETDLFIEWVYNINFDEMTFSVDGGFYDGFSKIDELDPVAWIENFTKRNEELAATAE